MLLAGCRAARERCVSTRSLRVFNYFSFNAEVTYCIASDRVTSQDAQLARDHPRGPASLHHTFRSLVVRAMRRRP